MDVPLNFDRERNARREREGSEGSEDFFAISEILEQLVGFVRRQFPIFVFIVSCSIALGLVYLFTTPASFTAHAMLLIDSSKLRILQQQQGPIGDIPIDTAQVETQVEILKSENIGLSVVKEMKLADDPEFAGSGGGLLGRVFGSLKAPDLQSEDQLGRKALGAFLARRAITRVGRTYVLDIAYTSLDAARAAAISNAVADAYIVDQLESKYQATRRASSWLQDRIRELRQQVSDADRAVLDYKEKNKIVAVGGTTSGGSRLLGEQQLEELNTQLGTARASAEEAKARLQRIDEVMKKDVPDATVTDSLRNEVINRLRNNYLDLASKEAIWSARYGASHLAAVNLRTQMTELRRAILDELGRIAQGYKSDYEIAKSRIEGLERNLSSLVSETQVINRDRLGLRDLESTAQVYHTLYDSFLQRYMEAIQQQSFPITEARVISAASAPRQKSSPVTTYVLALASFIGVLLSFGAAFLRETVDQVFRTTRQIESVLHANCLAVLPKLGGGSKQLAKKGRNWSGRVVGKTAEEGASGDSASVIELALAAARSNQYSGKTRESKISQVTQSSLTQNPLGRNRVLASGSAGRSVISRNRQFMRQVIDEPLSAFAEAFRSIKVAADLSGSRKDSNNRVIGITSTLPNEGKSTIASNLAQLIAHAGKRAILLDCDLRNPSLTRALAPGAKEGLLEVLNKTMDWRDAIYLDEDTGLNFLPVVVESRIFHTNEILASEGFKDVVERLREAYDYVIVDFSPMAPVVDVRATTEVIDCYLYVVEWGKTRINLVQHQLMAAPELHDRLLGVVLNKADVRILERYEAYYGRDYYKKYYGGQYPYSA
jgi:polysaccharide biosynthesis transport protein